MTREETIQWLKDQAIQHVAKQRLRKHRFRKYPTHTQLLFKLTLKRTGQQVTINREARSWTRRQLAMRTGLKESIIRNIENGKSFGVTIYSFNQIAHAFDCAFDVSFVAIIKESERLSITPTPEMLYVPSFTEETLIK